MDDREFRLKVLRGLESIQGRITRLEEVVEQLDRRLSVSDGVDLPRTPRSTPMLACGCRWTQGTGLAACADHAAERSYPMLGEYDPDPHPPAPEVA